MTEKTRPGARVLEGEEKAEAEKFIMEARARRDTKGIGVGIWPILFRGWPFYAAEWHDTAYTLGSWHQANMSRKEVDDFFLEQTLLLSNMGKLKPLKRVASYTMYGITRTLGWIWWEGKR